MATLTALEAHQTLISSGWVEHPSGEQHVGLYAKYFPSAVPSAGKHVAVTIRVYRSHEPPRDGEVSSDVIAMNTSLRARLPDTSWCEITRDHVPGGVEALSWSAGGMVRAFEDTANLWCPSAARGPI